MLKQELVLLVFAGFVVGFFAHSIFFTQDPNFSFNSLYTNDQYIKGLYNELDLSDNREVLRFVFNSLPDEVTVFPAENFYYFRFTANGMEFGGAFAFPADEVDDGNIGFSYVERPSGPSLIRRDDLVGSGKGYNSSNGVIVEKAKDEKWAYDVRFEGRTVRFIMFDAGFEKPVTSELLDSEFWVGPVFDESGLAFHLIFNENVSTLYHVLNEDRFVAETFRPYKDSLLVGERTGFVFYSDTENNRKILVGVKGENVANNNWFDGPFDHMPDNYIKDGLIPNYKEIIEAAYPYAASEGLDEYGQFVNEPGTRVAIGPYLVYWSLNEVDLRLNHCKNNYVSEDEFLECLTEQVYYIPRTENSIFY